MEKFNQGEITPSPHEAAKATEVLHHGQEQFRQTLKELAAEPIDENRRKDIGKVVGQTIEKITEHTLRQMNTIILSLSKAGGDAIRHAGMPALEFAGEGIKKFGSVGIELSGKLLTDLAPKALKALGLSAFKVAAGVYEGIGEVKKARKG